jgi:hypothetical protein
LLKFIILGVLEYNEIVESVIVSNLTFTMNDFHNVFHCNKDYNSYFYDIWAPTFLKFDDITSRRLINLIMKVGSL